MLLQRSAPETEAAALFTTKTDFVCLPSRVDVGETYKCQVRLFLNVFVVVFSACRLCLSDTRGAVSVPSPRVL